MTDQPCPHCGQGIVHRYTVINSGERFSSCEDCEASWPAGVPVEEFNSTFLDDFLYRKGIDRNNWCDAVTRG